LQAIEIARRQDAKTWELRALMSLVRLRENGHDRDEARRLLGTAVRWFSEGFDSNDLKAAKALLSTDAAKARK
jgi:predicted ATPase